MHAFNAFIQYVTETAGGQRGYSDSEAGRQTDLRCELAALTAGDIEAEMGGPY
jgi:hypothetical protein